MEWKEYNICQLCDTISETYKGKSNSVVLINTSDVLEGKVLNHKRVPNKGLKGQFKKTFKKNDILYSEIRPANKRFAYINFSPNDYIASTKLMVLRSKPIVSSHFLFQILKSEIVLKNLQMLAESRSGTFPQITYSELSNVRVKVPPLPVQDKIVGILSALDSKIENNNKINANLEAQAEALFKSWFVDFTPFKDQPFVDSELGPIPQGWKVGKINEFVDVIYGAPYKSKLFNTQKEGLPLIRIRDLKTSSPQFYTKELLPNTELVNYGDVVAGMDAEFTPHIWLGETGLLNQRVCKFKPHTGISPLYSMLMIKPKLEFAQNYKVGTTVSHLGKSDIDKFIVIVPPLDIVKEVSSIFDAVLNEQINLAKENQRLAALRDTLLPKLMSGEIKL